MIKQASLMLLISNNKNNQRQLTKQSLAFTDKNLQIYQKFQRNCLIRL